MNTMIDAAIKFLSSYHCSERELRIQLEKEFTHLQDLDEHIDAVIARLRELYLINDTRLAASLADRYIHKGNRFIHQILRQKGLSDDVIANVLENLSHEETRALDEARKKKRSLQGETAEKIKTKLVRFLSGRGFSHTTIRRVIEQLDDDLCPAKAKS